MQLFFDGEEKTTNLLSSFSFFPVQMLFFYMCVCVCVCPFFHFPWLLFLYFLYHFDSSNRENFHTSIHNNNKKKRLSTTRKKR